MVASGASRNMTITVRATASQRDLIDLAASVRHTTRAEFVLSAACEKAEEVLLDRSFFALDAKRFRQFEKALNSPAKPNAKVLRLLASKSIFDR
ncbi:MAG: DUF1778 domain-containing protein [Burkholderiaceae bacterium]|nr:DUF1778 domain-containing protein [Burkholderiaceae bacterium]